METQPHHYHSPFQIINVLSHHHISIVPKFGTRLKVEEGIYIYVTFLVSYRVREFASLGMSHQQKKVEGSILSHNNTVPVLVR